jgi:hypothetical protein
LRQARDASSSATGPDDGLEVRPSRGEQTGGQTGGRTDAGQVRLEVGHCVRLSGVSAAEHEIAHRAVRTINLYQFESPAQIAGVQQRAPRSGSGSLLIVRCTGARSVSLASGGLEATGCLVVGRLRGRAFPLLLLLGSLCNLQWRIIAGAVKTRWYQVEAYNVLADYKLGTEHTRTHARTQTRRELIGGQWGTSFSWLFPRELLHFNSSTRERRRRRRLLLLESVKREALGSLQP